MTAYVFTGWPAKALLLVLVAAWSLPLWWVSKWAVDRFVRPRIEGHYQRQIDAIADTEPEET